jgi:hypothetical protein
MSAKTSQARQLDKINRAERLLATIAILEEQIKSIRASGEVAPKGCHLARYQARGQYKAYWYYKLQAVEPIFTSKKGQGKPSRYKHLGSAGTSAHVDGVMMVIRRNQIDELQKSIDALRDSWSDLYSDLEDTK